jgi:uncharacterized protein involved in exopolysaccharide biosynthesis
MPGSQKPSPATAYEDEIPLIDLWLILVKRKMVLIGVFVLVMLAALGYMLLVKPVYESSALVQIGQIGQVGSDGKVSSNYIEAPDVLIKTLGQNPDIQSEPGARLAGASYQKSGAKNLVTVKVEASSAEAADTYLNKVLTAFIAKHKRMFESVMHVRQQRLGELESQLYTYEAQLKAIDAGVMDLMSSKPEQASVLLIQKSQLIQSIADSRKEIFNLKESLSEVNTSKTVVISQSGLASSPTKPKLKMVLALSVVLGLMLGFMAAFFAEFLSNARQELKKAREE